VSSYSPKKYTVVKEPIGTHLLEVPDFKNDAIELEIPELRSEAIEWLDVPMELFESEFAQQIMQDLNWYYENPDYESLQTKDIYGNKSVEIFNNYVNKIYSYDKHNQELKAIKDYEEKYRVYIAQVDAYGFLNETTLEEKFYDYGSSIFFEQMKFNRAGNLVEATTIRNYFFINSFLEIDLIEFDSMLFLHVADGFNAPYFTSLARHDYDLLAKFHDDENVEEFIKYFNLLLNVETIKDTPTLTKRI